ncbi:ferrichrome-binding periplasmic protein [Salmonella enterica subsp. diarizonae]|uniref:Ferrichrome-binding periplasmic protein n=1 Tax=Salmonella diarizonae TaxID=59204 RepID=A0A379U429_SALDZ|nr:ferrichrome-binding periplasmic protein [Salmonella enterica subsp. diarizonae]
MRDLYPLTRRHLLTAMALSPLLWQMNTAQAAAIDSPPDCGAGVAAG